MSEQRVCLVHYHEIGLKGKNRAHFEKQLITNIKAVLGDAPVARIKRISGRICLFEGGRRNLRTVVRARRSDRGYPWRCARVVRISLRAES